MLNKGMVGARTGEGLIGSYLRSKKSCTMSERIPSVWEGDRCAMMFLQNSFSVFSGL